MTLADTIADCATVLLSDPDLTDAQRARLSAHAFGVATELLQMRRERRDRYIVRSLTGWRLTPPGAPT